MRKDIHIHPPAAAARSPLRAVPAPRDRRRPRAGRGLADLTNPASSYLSQLADSGQRSMRARLDRAARVLLPGSSTETFPWGDLRYEDVIRVRARLPLEGLSPTSVNLTLIALRRTAREARALGQMSAETEAAIRGVEMVRTEPALSGRMLTAAERRRLFAACRRAGGARARRDACIVALALGAGLRREECAGLDVGALEPGHRRLRLTGKGGRETVLPLHPAARRAVGDWLRVRGRGPGPLLAPVSARGEVEAGRAIGGQDVYRAVLRLAERAGLAPCTPHDLRRTFISELLSRTDQFTAQRLARHRNASTTGRYDRRGEREAARAVESVYVPYERPPSKARPKQKPLGAKKKTFRRRVNKAL